MVSSNQITLRHNLIMNYLEARKYASIRDLCDLCNVSSSTIRRDITILEEKDLVIPVRDGIIQKYAKDPNPFQLERTIHHFKEKQAIGKAAATLVQDNESIFISSGSTTVYMVPFLTGKKGVTVITNALNIVSKLIEIPSIKIVILGGELEGDFNLMGHLTEIGINNIISQKIFQSATGIHPEYGITTDAPTDAPTEDLIISKFGELIVLADHTKFSRLGPVPLAPITAISTLITDSLTPKAPLEKIKKAGVRVIQVEY